MISRATEERRFEFVLFVLFSVERIVIARVGDLECLSIGLTWRVRLKIPIFWIISGFVQNRRRCCRRHVTRRRRDGRLQSLINCANKRGWRFLRRPLEVSANSFFAISANVCKTHFFIVPQSSLVQSRDNETVTTDSGCFGGCKRLWLMKRQPRSLACYRIEVKCRFG